MTDLLLPDPPTDPIAADKACGMAAMNHHRPDGFVLGRRESCKDSRMTVLGIVDVVNILWSQIAELLRQDIPRAGNVLSISTLFRKTWSGCLDMATPHLCHGICLVFASESNHRKAGDIDRIACHGC
jgi:hypothetical protein